MKRWLRILPIAAIVAAMPLVIAACGDDDDDTTNGESAPTEMADETPASGNGMNGDSDETTIVSTADEAGSFATLLTAVDAAGLTETLESDGPFTVFAPTDDAFEALPEGTLDDLLADTDALANVLQYHVVQGEVTSDMLEDGQDVEMLNGETLTVSIDGDTVMIGDATVTSANVDAGNGVIHVIDTVLVPAS